MESTVVLDLFGHVGYVFILYGLWLLTQGRKFGWGMRFVGEAIWVILGFALGMSSIWMWGLVFMSMDIVGYYRWSTKENDGD